MTDLENYQLSYSSKSGANVWVHAQHGEAELPANLLIGHLLADWGKTVWLLPTSNEPGTKNPDAQVDDELWEFKTNHAATGTSIDSAIREAHKQAPNILLYLTVAMPIPNLENALYGRVRKCANLVKLSVLTASNLYTFSKAEILSQTFRGIIKGEGSPA